MDAIAGNYSSSESEQSNDDTGGTDGADGGEIFEVISVQRAPKEASQDTVPKKASDLAPVSATTVPKEDAALARWVMEALKARVSSGVRLEEEVRKNKNFKNPAILDKMIEYCGIDEHASLLRDAQAKAHRSDDADEKNRSSLNEK